MKRLLIFWMVVLIGVRSQFNFPGGSYQGLRFLPAWLQNSFWQNGNFGRPGAPLLEAPWVHWPHHPVEGPGSSPHKTGSRGGDGQQKLVSGGSSNGRNSFTPRPEDVSLPKLTSENYLTAASAAHVEIKKLELKRIEKEKILIEQNIFIQPNTPASYHSSFFQSTPETIAVGASGLKALDISLLLLKQNYTMNELSEMCNSMTNSDLQLSGSPYHVVQCPNPFSRFRTMNGSCNNLEQPNWGMINTALDRLVPAKYNDGIHEPRLAKSGQELPSARLISQELTDCSRHAESEVSTLMLMQWGQFIDHDAVMTPLCRLREDAKGVNCCQDGQLMKEAHLHFECFPIIIPESDPFFSQHNQRCMNFVRSIPAARPGCLLGNREQQNALTAFLDGSQIYGFNEKGARELRTLDGGQLEIQRTKNGDALLPEKKDISPEECRRHATQKFCFKAGDGRVNEQPNLAVDHTIWVREHNRIANELQRLNPDWDDERLYQESRRIVGAEIQQITYNEYFPILLGDRFMSAFRLKSRIGREATKLYDPKMNPSITNEFAAAAFRMGHSMVPGILKGYNEDGVQSHNLVLNEHQFKPFVLYEDNGVETLVRGLVTQASQKVDRVFTDEIRNHLFQGDQKFGMDLVALNIQRGRDHGLAPYNDYREYCGKPRAQRWEDFLDVFDLTVVEGMKRIYGDVDDVDLYIGGVSERPVKGAVLGPTFLCIIGDQAARWRCGDRFFFEEVTAGFTPQQLASLRQVTLARILCDTSDDNIESIQPNAFIKLDFQHRLACKGTMIPNLDLNLWRE